MDSTLSSTEAAEIESLARKYGVTAEQVKAVIRQTGSQSRKQIERALDREFSQQGNPT